MILQDTRPLKCGECGSTDVGKEVQDNHEFAVCEKCGHKGFLRIHIPPGHEDQLHRQGWTQHQEPHRKF